MEEVVVCEYNPEWVTEYNVEKVKIVQLLKDLIQGIEHIGSTAIPGLAAKPVIDMMVGINNLQDLTKLHYEQLKTIGYEFVDHPHFPERRFFRKGQWRAGTHHLHIYEHKADNWNSNLLFRDYLINHPDLLREYNVLKKELELVYKNDRAAYTKAKAPFIESVIRKAKESSHN
ncbi:GrpB family protein [Paenibacillus radicis (ex Xue et al. 2023)]|uniref:GrpB family protein n=1 Tax=Paenibacillus radicis (ex Xue et al. 2023) TaxID=2972489 RepID=A0ABT1YB76_9BACL|nr:GrpB family protein [Paenibacillus radicis (ex Xue et al. 2023)]MCR8630454.1 GrpB family protein [Paenibacillus radicis (ex Xue et al. 2023)]